MTIYAFNKADNEYPKAIYESVKNGISRFGWSFSDESDLNRVWTKENSKQWFLKKIKPGDWIVHINTPEWGKCVATQVVSEYEFDAGIKFEDGHVDFRHCIGIDKASIVEFDRNDANVLPSVSARLKLQGRYWRIHTENAFSESLENIKNEKVKLPKGESRGIYHLKEKNDPYLAEITKHIHAMHAGKELEGFLAKVIRRIPGAEVIENGSGWGTDHGADLIVTLESKIGSIDFKHKVIVQVKSYEGKIYDLNAVKQIKDGIAEFNGAAGLIITTAERTEQLEKKIEEVSKEINKPIDLLAGREVAWFVFENAPDLLFNP